jgi:KDO2-lipid IV(A) lauroyltransferase
MKRRKALGRAVGRGALRLVILLVRALPFNSAMAIGRGLGNLVRILSKKRYNVALQNLQIAYGDELTDAERHRIAAESFKSFGMFMVESVKFGYMSKDEVMRRVAVCPECFTYFEDITRDGNGCLFITGHLGNFEILGRWYTDRGYELVALSREARDRGTTNIISEIRERMGIKVININQSLRPVLEALKRNASVAIICDQNAADVFVPFFGQQTGTVDGPAKIALRTGAPMLFFMGVRDGGGKYHIECNGYYRPESTGDTRSDLEKTMAEVNRNLEEMIRRHPEQWLWFHDRWKSSPGVKDNVKLN